MRVLALALLALAGLAAPASAQDLRLDETILQMCLEDAGPDGDKSACIGVAANQCMEQPGGYSTYGMSACLDMELKWWDEWLNFAYQDARDWMKQRDAGAQPPLNVQAQTLLDMQRAWIKFRDAKCGLEATFFQGGTGAGPAHLTCIMHETGEQALYLSTLGPAG